MVRGHKAIRIKGKYFTTFKRHNSTHKELGEAIIARIPHEPNQFQVWLADMLSTWNTTYSCYFDEYGAPRQEMVDTFDDDQTHDFAMFPSDQPPETDSFIEHTYVIDLDRLAFTVDNYSHFRLDAIPREGSKKNWFKYLAQDGTDECCLFPCTPRQYVADLSLPPDNPDMRGVAAYARFQHLISIRPFPLHEDTMPLSIAINAAKNCIRHLYRSYSLIGQYRRTDDQFRTSALLLLVAISPSFKLLANAFNGKDYMEQKARLEMLEERDILFVWIRGVLVRFATHLHLEAKLDTELGLLVERLEGERQSTKVSEITGILWSVKKFVLVTVSEFKVERSPLYDILDVYGTEEYDDTTDLHLSILARALSLKKSFSPPLHFHARLPLEIIERILFMVSDETTHRNCVRVCKTLYTLIINYPRMDDFTLLSNVWGRTYRAHHWGNPDRVVRVRWSTRLIGRETASWSLWKLATKVMEIRYETKSKN